MPPNSVNSKFELIRSWRGQPNNPSSSETEIETRWTGSPLSITRPASTGANSIIKIIGRLRDRKFMVIMLIIRVLRKPPQKNNLLSSYASRKNTISKMR